MGLRRLGLVFLSLATLVAISFTVQPKADPRPPGKPYIEIKLIKPNPKVCLFTDVQIGIWYIYHSGTNMPPAEIEGSGKVTGTLLNSIQPDKWDVLRPDEIKGFTYEAEVEGSENITFALEINGVKAKVPPLHFDVLLCAYHTDLEASIVEGRGGGTYFNMEVVGIWDAQGDFSIDQKSNAVSGYGGGKLESIYTGFGPEGETCNPTNTYTAKTNYKYTGSNQKKKGIRLGFKFDQYFFLPHTPISCLIEGKPTTIPNQFEPSDLNELSIAKEQLYATFPVEKWFDFFNGTGVLIIEKAKGMP